MRSAVTQAVELRCRNELARCLVKSMTWPLHQDLSYLQQLDQGADEKLEEPKPEMSLARDKDQE